MFAATGLVSLGLRLQIGVFGSLSLQNEKSRNKSTTFEIFGFLKGVFHLFSILLFFFQKSHPGGSAGVRWKALRRKYTHKSLPSCKGTGASAQGLILRICCPAGSRTVSVEWWVLKQQGWQGTEHSKTPTHRSRSSTVWWPTRMRWPGSLLRAQSGAASACAGGCVFVVYVSCLACAGLAKWGKCTWIHHRVRVNTSFPLPLQSLAVIRTHTAVFRCSVNCRTVRCKSSKTTCRLSNLGWVNRSSARYWISWYFLFWTSDLLVLLFWYCLFLFAS